MRTLALYALAATIVLNLNSHGQSDVQNRRLAVVTSVKGDATYTSGTIKAAKLRAGLSLPEGTQIVTSPRATVDLYFRQIETIFRLTPDTDITLEKLDKREKNGVVFKQTVARLDKGRILTRARVRVQDSTFEIRTKNLVYTVPESGVARFDVRSNGTVIVGKKSQLSLRVVDVGAASTNTVVPSQIFDPKEHRTENANPTALQELFEELTELDDLAQALTPPKDAESPRNP